MSDQENRPMGRPTDYSQEKLNLAAEYVEKFGEYGDSIPSVAGLACVLKVSKSTVYLWKRDHQEFSDTLEKILTSQERHALNGGISGQFNSTISKLVLANHGYSDSTVIDQTTTHKGEVTLAERLTGGSKR